MGTSLDEIDRRSVYFVAWFQVCVKPKRSGLSLARTRPAPSLKGCSGVGELGLTLTPSTHIPLSIDLGVQGHVGQRQGVSGNVLVNWEF